jgi:hypothetical protein
MLFETKKSHILLYITFSDVLENIVSNETGLYLDMWLFTFHMQ